MASIVGNNPQASPDNALAQTVAADKSIIENTGCLDLFQAEAIPERRENYGRICEVAEEIEEGPKE